MKHILIVVLILFLSNFNSNACSCFYEPMSVKKINHYDIVFRGKVLKKEKVKDIPSSKSSDFESNFKMEYFKYTFDIVDRVKLFTKAKTIAIYSSTSGASCGVNYEVGDELYIFSYKSNQTQMTGLCANNVSVKNADKKFMKVVDQYKNPKQNKVWKDEECQLVARGKFVNGKPDGLWTYYNSDGSIQSKGLYSNGLKEGAWLSYLDEVASNEYIAMLSKEQRQQVTNEKNVIDGEHIFKAGKRVKINHRFVLGGN